MRVHRVPGSGGREGVLADPQSEGGAKGRHPGGDVGGTVSRDQLRGGKAGEVTLFEREVPCLEGEIPCLERKVPCLEGGIPCLKREVPCL